MYTRLQSCSCFDSAFSSCCCTFSSNFFVAMAEQLCSNPWQNSFVERKIWDHPSKWPKNNLTWRVGSSGRAASGGALAPEPPCATRNTPDFIRNLSKKTLFPHYLSWAAPAPGIFFKNFSANFFSKIWVEPKIWVEIWLNPNWEKSRWTHRFPVRMVHDRYGSWYK